MTCLGIRGTMNRTQKYRILREQIKQEELVVKNVRDKLDYIILQLNLLVELENINSRREITTKRIK